MTRYTRLVIGVAIGAATILASALAFAQPASAQGHWRHGGGAHAPSGGPAPQFHVRPSPPPVYRHAPPVHVSPPAPVYRPTPHFVRPQPPVYVSPPAIHRPHPPVYRPHVRPWIAPPPPPVVYQPYPVYPAAPVYQDYPGEPAYGCVWRKHKVRTPFGLRTKWRRVCY